MMASNSLQTEQTSPRKALVERLGALTTSRRFMIGAVAFAFVLFVLPQIASAYWLKSFTTTAIFALVAAGAALLYGRLGLVSLAQVALLGVGGWIALRLSHGTALPFELVLLLGGVGAGVIGLIIGLPALRMRGLYLALITLMAAGGFQVIISGTGFPDGGPGFLGRVITGNRSLMERPLLGQTDIAYFRYTVIVVALGFLLVAAHLRGRPGRAWALIRRGEACALSAGVDVTLYKTWAFTLAGFLSGIAGGLLAGSVGQLDGRSFPASDSIMLFALTVVGGAYNMLGPILTGVLFKAFPALLNQLDVNGDVANVVFGVALLQALITAPTGISGQMLDGFRALGAAIDTRMRRS